MSSPDRAEMGPPEDVLRKALSGAAMAPRLAGALPDGAAPTAARRICRVLDAKYDPGTRLVVLYELDGRLVVGKVGWRDHSTRTLAPRRIPELGMEVYPFPADPKLPGVAVALAAGDGGTPFRKVLARHLGAGIRVLRCRVGVVRYRPMQRCTLRIDLTLRHGRVGAVADRTLYAKVYDELAKAEAAHLHMVRLHRSEVLPPAGIQVAEPVALLTRYGIVVQEPLAGASLGDMLHAARPGAVMPGALRMRGVRRAAVALAMIHAADVPTERARPVAPFLDRMRRRAERVGSAKPDLGRAMLDLADALGGTIGAVTCGAPVRLVHGDCKPSQFLISAGAVSVLDFDHCGGADPAQDVGDFMAALRQVAVRREARRRAGPDGSGDPEPPLEAAFFDAYLSRSCSSSSLWDRARWYQSLALFRKAYRSFQRDPRSNLPDALMREAWACAPGGPGWRPPAAALRQMPAGPLRGRRRP